MPVVNVKKVARLQRSSAKRGDTIIEVMFAIAVFSLVAVLTIAMMNGGVSDAQGALELVVARNELNAQAEAIRFIHSSYLSELTLPTCGDDVSSEKCQQYAELWGRIKDNAIEPPSATLDMERDRITAGLLNLAEFINDRSFDLPFGCDRVYSADAEGNNILSKNKAFLLNTRNLNNGATGSSGGAASLISTEDSEQRKLFRPASLNARVLYKSSQLANGANSETFLEDNLLYDEIEVAEGIWVIAVKENDDDDPSYYDFYIEGCWYSPGAITPTVLDTVIRLYNPGGAK